MVHVKKTAVQATACLADALCKKATTLTRRQQAWYVQGAGIVFAVLLSLLLAGTPLAARAQAPSDKQELERQIQKLARDLQDVQSKLAAMQADTAARDAEALKKATAQPAPAAPASHPQATPQSAQAPQPPEERVAPGTRPGSTTPATSSVSPFANYSLTVGATQPTTAEQKGHKLFEKKPGRTNTFYTKNGEVTFFANLGVSFDDATKGMKPIWLGTSWLSPSDPNYVMWGPPVGNMGWLEDVAAPGSSFGIRGTESTWIKNVNLIYQLETGFVLAASPGLHESGSQESDVVNGTLFTGTSYVGLGKVGWGAILFGKTNTPYMQSTARLDPFGGMEGSYSVVMGNTGGDNRVEFGTAINHAIWYTSPNLRGITFNVLFSPGQNRDNNSGALPSGEPACTGGDDPGNGGLTPIACNDGSWSDAVSANVSYTKEPLYITVAYERHMKVNRQSDITGVYTAVPSLWASANGAITTNDPNFPADEAAAYPNYTGTVTFIKNDINESGNGGWFFYAPTNMYNADVADEDAGKVGIQYSFFNKKTVIGAVGENFHRYVPYYMEWQNERQRRGLWVAGTQALGKNDSFSLGWARAFRAPGDPCQHNDCIIPAPDTVFSDGLLTAGRGAHNQSNMFSIAYRRTVGPGLVSYINWAGTYNGAAAHFDLGAGGHGIVTDCHDDYDTSGAATNQDVVPHQYTGCKEKAISIGLQKRF
jgi:predicted porin/outer membrane murein-binding lipoprotein Lpp